MGVYGYYMVIVWLLQRQGKWKRGYGDDVDGVDGWICN
jgi:hypothetical protein